MLLRQKDNNSGHIRLALTKRLINGKIQFGDIREDWFVRVVWRQRLLVECGMWKYAYAARRVASSAS